QKVTGWFKELIKEHTGREFPQDPWEQLRLAVEAVCKSWHGNRASDYRNATGIPHNLGTGVHVQTTVFGTVGWDSGSGVAFTRNPATGEKDFFGEYLFNAQGEDVVSGARTPIEVHHLAEDSPEAWETLNQIAQTLERHYRDMQ